LLLRLLCWTGGRLLLLLLLLLFLLIQPLFPLFVSAQRFIFPLFVRVLLWHSSPA
jgi:hypothetical protein